MPRHFNYHSIQHAYLSQCPDTQGDPSVIRCYRCGKKMDTYYKEDEGIPIQKVPTEKGGRFNKENCILVCTDCYDKTMEERKQPPVEEPLFDDS
jgi:hypothetical protein